MTAPPPGFNLARLLGGEGDRFQFGVRRGRPEFWRERLGQESSNAVLAERARLLNDPGTRADAVTWSDPAAPALAETTEWLGLSAGAISPDAAGAASLGRRWEPDWVLLRSSRPGPPRLVAGCVCFPSHWAVTEKLGLTVPEIHGVVPTLNADLGARIATFLDRLAPGAVFERENWGLAATPDPNQHPRRALPRLAADTPPESVWLRLEHQAFVALPRSAAILFIIGVRVAPLVEALADPALRAAFGRQLAAIPADVAAYKGLTALRRSPSVQNFFAVGEAATD